MAAQDDGRGFPPECGSAVTDERLMRLIARDDALALHQLMQRHWAYLVAFAARVLDDTDAAADVVQQAFIQLWQSRARWQPSGSVSAYLYRITRNAALNEQRGRHPHEQLDSDPEQAIAATGNTPLEAIEAEELRDAIDAAVERLPARRRSVYRLASDEHLSHEEISRRMGISQQTVANQLSAARADLRRQLRAVLDD